MQVEDQKAIVEVALKLTQDVIDGAQYQDYTQVAPSIFSDMGKYHAAIMLKTLLAKYLASSPSDMRLYLVSLRILRDAHSKGASAVAEQLGPEKVTVVYLEGFAEMTDSIVGLFD